MSDLEYCVWFLAKERYGEAEAQRVVDSCRNDASCLFDTFRGLANTREPLPATGEFLEVQDRMLRDMIAGAGITCAEELPRVPFDARVSLWRGDITTLEVDAVVNAANSQMLGCWVPGHHCIDNAIHTFAGVQLRAACAKLMAEQGHPEPTGAAKVTPAFNLPSKWIVHTVGPIANGRPSNKDRSLLASCYTSCLDAASEIGSRSIAFCCVSTGVFGFPQDEAARIAVNTVKDWLERAGSDMHVIFNVFQESDEGVYRELLLS